jgi:hypothetical protein
MLKQLVASFVMNPYFSDRLLVLPYLAQNQKLSS